MATSHLGYRVPNSRSVSGVGLPSKEHQGPLRAVKGRGEREDVSKVWDVSGGIFKAA